MGNSLHSHSTTSGSKTNRERYQKRRSHLLRSSHLLSKYPATSSWPSLAVQLLASFHLRNNSKVAEAMHMLKTVETSESSKSRTPIPITITFGTKDAAYQIMEKSSPLTAQL